MSIHVRAMAPADHASAGALAEAAGLFPADMLPGLAQEEGARLFVAEGPGLIGLAYAVPEMMTEGTWNLRAIAVAEDARRRTAGRALMEAAEMAAKQAGGRMMIVDTSGQPGFAGARAFYTALGYGLEATIRGYWAEGDDKITYCKRL